MQNNVQGTTLELLLGRLIVDEPSRKLVGMPIAITTPLNCLATTLVSDIISLLFDCRTINTCFVFLALHPTH